MSHTIDLIVPGLCGPLPELSDLHDDKTLLSFISWIARATKKTTKDLAYPEQLCRLMGVDEKNIPLAELSLSGYGIDRSGYHWMFADPVHMRADVDHAILYDSNSLDLSFDEAEVLIADLNRHFEHDGYEFILADANHWFIRSRQPFDVSSRRLSEVVTQNINQLMPKGVDATRCKQLLNESQMLLHASSINQQREQKGLLTVNSIWLWGEGRLNKLWKSRVTRCYGDDILLRGLAKVLDVDRVSTGNIEKLFAKGRSGERSVVVFDDLIAPCSYGDISSWLETFVTLYHDVLFQFLTSALSSNIEINCYPCNGYSYTIDSNTKWRFWRRGNLEQYFETNDH